MTTLTVPELKELISEYGYSGQWWTMRVGLAELWPKKGWGMGLRAEYFSSISMVFDLISKSEQKTNYPGIPSVNSAPDVDSVYAFNSPVGWVPCCTYFISKVLGYEQNPIYQVEFGEQVAQRLIKRERDNLYAAFDRWPKNEKVIRSI